MSVKRRTTNLRNTGNLGKFCAAKKTGSNQPVSHYDMTKSFWGDTYSDTKSKGGIFSILLSLINPQWEEGTWDEK